MGIPMLTSFMHKRFDGWKVEEIRGNLVIDGDALCYDLYDSTGLFDWKHGGEYVQFRAYAVEYFTALRSSSIEPIVVFDGIDYTGEKSETILGRYDQSVQTICSVFQPHDVTQPPESGTPRQDYKVVKPIFLKKILSEVLNEFNIKFVVVDGEADKEIALLANSYRCPVLSNDSDFYIYPVIGGFIHMNDFDWQSQPIKSKVYHVKAMVDEFKFADESLRFIIPAISGNDFIESLSYNCRPFMRHIKQVTAYRVGSGHPMEAIITYASHYDNLQDFINRIQSIDYLNTSSKKVLRNNCIKSKQIYDIQGVRSLDNLRCKSELKIDKLREIPKWLLSQYRRVELSSGVMITMVCGGYVLPVLAENTEKETSYCISLPLRQATYNILGLGERGESLRVGEVFVGFKIPSCLITCSGVKLNDIDLIPTLPKSTKKKVIYHFLRCKADLIESLDEKWKLVIASVVFWAKRAKIQQSAIKALLLTFVLCSSGTYTKVELPDNAPVKSPEWLEGVHYFMQWQCSYKDANSLNNVLQMPLEFYSPAHLYSGRLVHKLYIASETTSMVSELPKDAKELYDKLLSTVLSHKEVGRSRSTGSNAPSKSNILVATAKAHIEGQEKFVTIPE